MKQYLEIQIDFKKPNNINNERKKIKQKETNKNLKINLTTKFFISIDCVPIFCMAENLGSAGKKWVRLARGGI